jgi:hypothetical protein
VGAVAGAGGLGVAVALGTAVGAAGGEVVGEAVGGMGVADGGMGVAVAVLVAAGSGVRLGTGVGGTGLAVAVCSGVLPAGTSCVADNVGQAVAVAVAAMATGRRAERVGVAAGDGVPAAARARAEPATTNSTSRTGAYLRRRFIRGPSPTRSLNPNQSWRQLPPSEQGGVPQRSSRPQQVRPGGCRMSLLSTCGAEKSRPSVRGLPQSGQVGTLLWERTRTCTKPWQLEQRYS